MEFRLTYRGSLASNGSLEQKQALRRAFNPQLAELWRLKTLSEIPHFLSPTPDEGRTSLLCVVGGFTCCAVVSSRIALVADLEILLLRPQEPGSLLGHGGDLDNRLKTLLDALRLPSANEIPNGDAPDANEDPFHCLLEDDALVSKLAITTDRLLAPASRSHVEIVIHVKTRPTVGTWANISLAG
jgi:hypothetical protein